MDDSINGESDCGGRAPKSNVVGVAGHRDGSRDVPNQGSDDSRKFVEWLFIDEAVALVKSGRGRVLRDPLDVLRNLAARGDFKVVLVSTPRILPSLQLSGELARRAGEVFFPRYGSGRGEFKSFCRVLTTLMEVLPKSSRLRPEPEQLRLFQAGSLGCVGHLADWFRRALARCAESRADTLA